MVFLEPKNDEIDKARNELNLAMQLLTKALDRADDGDLTASETQAIRVGRAERMHAAATRLYNAVTGRRTR